MPQKTVFLIVPHYVYSSDLLHTEYIKYLSETYKVVVIGPVFKTVPESGYYHSPNIIYKAWDTSHRNFWLRFNKMLRLSLITEFNHLDYHKLRAYTGINLTWKRKALMALAKLFPKKLFSADNFTKIESFMLPEDVEFKKLISEYRPSLIITSTPGFSETEAEAIILAKKNNIKTVAVNFSWDNLFNTSKQIRKTDYLITWNEIVKRAAIDIHNYPAEKVFVSGVMRFDHHFKNGLGGKNNDERNKFMISKGLDPILKTILFTTVPPHTYPFQAAFVKELMKSRDKNILGVNFNILVRLHPRDDLKNYESFQNIENLRIELAGKEQVKQAGHLNRIEMDENDLDNIRKTFLYSDLAINFRSSIILETCLYDIPTINLAYNNYALYYQMDHYIPILKSGAVKLVKTPDEFIEAAKSYLNKPELDSQKRKEIALEYVPFQDGLSYKRNVDFLEEIIK